MVDGGNAPNGRSEGATDLEARLTALEEAVDEIADDHAEFDRRFERIERTLREMLVALGEIRQAVPKLTDARPSAERE